MFNLDIWLGQTVPEGSAEVSISNTPGVWCLVTLAESQRLRPWTPVSREVEGDISKSFIAAARLSCAM